MRKLLFPISMAVCVGLVVACAGIKKSPADKQKEAFDDFRAKVTEVVVEPDREAQAIELVSELERSFIEVRDANSREFAKARRINAEYDATREEIQLFLDDAIARVRSHQLDIVYAHRELRTILTEEEWDAIDRSKSRALSAAVKQLQAE